MFKKSSRSKNIRRKIETVDDESIEEEVTIKKTITSVEKKKKSIKKTALSFEDEEGDVEEFKIKKTARKLHLPETMTDGEDTKETFNYNQDYLDKLRAGTPSLPASVKQSLQQNEDELLHEKFPSLNNTVPGIGIPDASAILAAKKKREKMRKSFNITDNDDGFISLNDMDDEEDKTGSRLIREEDDVGDDGEAEFDQYMGEKFTLNQGSAKNQEKVRREGVREMIEEAEDDDDRSEDMERWEEDMMKYGGAKTQKTEYDPYSAPTNYRPAQIPDVSNVPSLVDVLKLLDITSKEVTESIQHSESALQESSKTVENSNIVDSDLTKEIERGSNRYNYFQQLAQYTDDLGEFFDAKIPELEKLESQVHDIISNKTETVLARRYQDNLDDLCLFTDIVAGQLDEEMEDEVDEFGRVRELRNSDAAKKRRREERLARISRNADLADLEGEHVIREQSLWTDDEMADEYYDQKDTKLMAIENEDIEKLLSDVGPAFNSIRAVMERFESWKLEFTDDYEKAYGSLSLPGAFEFYVRTELVSWDPFNVPIDFDSMRWHSTLSEFGVTPENEEPDIELINKVVEKSIIKRFKSLLDTLDVGSIKQMRHASQTVEQISYYVDTEEKAYKGLAETILETFEKQISQFIDLIATAIPRSNLSQESQEAKQRFFWSQCKYLKTLAVWRRYLPKEKLNHLGNLVHDRILLPILKPETYPEDLQLQTEASMLLSHLQK